MIIRLARTFKASAFGAMLAYVMLLNVLLAGFAQAAIVNHALNGGVEICLPLSGDADTSTPDQRQSHRCQMCCLAAQGHVALSPVGAGFIEHFANISKLPFHREDATLRAQTLFKEPARGPPFI